MNSWHSTQVNLLHEFVKVLSYLDVQFRDNWCGLHPMAYLWVKDNMGMEYLFIVPDSLPYKVPTLYKFILNVYVSNKIMMTETFHMYISSMYIWWKLNLKYKIFYPYHYQDFVWSTDRTHRIFSSLSKWKYYVTI